VGSSPAAAAVGLARGFLGIAASAAVLFFVCILPACKYWPRY
jgi:hypothetical protein